MLAVHLPAILPGTNPEFSTSVRLQTACLVGIGMTFMQTNDRKKIEQFATEIVGNEADIRESGHRMKSLTESYSVAAGFAVGFMALRKGGDMVSIANRLIRYLKGDTTAPVGTLSRSQNVLPKKDRKKNFPICEIVAASGSIVALALMFLKTGNKNIAKVLAVPTTSVGMDSVRVDVLTLRVVGRNLIMWDEIKPTNAWIRSQVPDFIYKVVNGHGFEDGAEEPSVNHYNLLISYLAIISGSCLSIGLRYAGSRDETAFATLTHWLDYFIRYHNMPGMFFRF